MEEEKASSMAVSNPTTTTSQNHRHRGSAILPGEIRQLFSLPESIIYYIAMNPSNAEVYKKLIRTCKYFYNKNPILVVNDLCYWEVGYGSEDDSYEDDASEDESDGGGGSDQIDYFEYVWKVGFKKSNYNPKGKVDMDMVPYKFWVTDFVSIAPNDEMHKNTAAFIGPKIYRCDADSIVLFEQILTLDELLILGSNVTSFLFDDVKIIENDGKTEVMFEKVIEKLPKIQKICWRTFYTENENISCFSKNTAAELTKLPHFANITQFILHSPFQMFDAKVLFDYMKTSNKNMQVDLIYDGDLSVQFKQKLDEIVDEIISTKVFTYKPPRIYYKDCDQNKLKQITEIQSRYRNTRF